MLDLETRCFMCNVTKYLVCGRGEDVDDGFLCVFCIRLMDGDYNSGGPRAGPYA